MNSNITLTTDAWTSTYHLACKDIFFIYSSTYHLTCKDISSLIPHMIWTLKTTYAKDRWLQTPDAWTLNTPDARTPTFARDAI